MRVAPPPTDLPLLRGRRAATLIAWLWLTGCSGSCHHEPLHEVRWPASPATSLEQALAATARAKSPAQPALDVPAISVIPEAAPEPPEIELPPDGPGLRATELELEGLWIAEIEIGEVEEGTPLPLVMMLHGRGDAPRLPGGPFERVPTPMRVLVPRGPLLLGAGYAWARSSVTQGRFDELARDLLEQSERLARVLDQVRAMRPTAGTPIVTGFSQGAMLAWVLAMQHPQAVGLAIPIAGWVPPAARSQPPSASQTFAMHGTADPIVKIEPTRELVELLRDAGNPIVFEEFPGVIHEVSEAMNIQFEQWLEQALEERAPGLSGGLGQPGADPGPIEPFEPALDVDLQQDAVPPPTDREAPPAPEPATIEEAPAPDETEPPRLTQ